MLYGSKTVWHGKRGLRLVVDKLYETLIGEVKLERVCLMIVITRYLNIMGNKVADEIEIEWNLCCWSVTRVGELNICGKRMLGHGKIQNYCWIRIERIVCLGRNKKISKVNLTLTWRARIKALWTIYWIKQNIYWYSSQIKTFT